MPKKSKNMHPHCVKCKKCACTAPDAKKCGTCGKTQKVRDFCAAHNRIFPQGVTSFVCINTGKTAAFSHANGKYCCSRYLWKINDSGSYIMLKAIIIE